MGREMALPREEYPRPLLVREQWLNLNGEWQFESDPGDVGLRERWYAGRSSSARILVPYPVESDASGVTPDDAASVIWYQRDFTVPSHWKLPRVCLHIGACDHWARVFVNGTAVDIHRSRSTSVTPLIWRA
jgi:beta-galactosidase/beta-glucuronidase